MSRPDWLDFSAIGVSGLCLVHCLASGVFVASLSAVSLSQFTASHEFHIYTLLAAIPLAVWALGRGWLRQRRAVPPALGGVGLALMAVGVLPSLAGSVETVLTMAGVTVLAAGHYLNWRGQRHDDAGCVHADGEPVAAASSRAPACCERAPAAQFRDAA